MDTLDQEGNIHPLDLLQPEEKNKIYFKRVVDLAVWSGLLNPDPNSHVGHFAFSNHYHDGKRLETKLAEEIAYFEAENPELSKKIRDRRFQAFNISEEEQANWTERDEAQHLILVGASYQIWPKGVSHALTYPWDLDGRGSPVTFRPDLTEFNKRRVIKILKDAGKLRDPNLFK